MKHRMMALTFFWKQQMYLHAGSPPRVRRIWSRQTV